MSNNVRYYKKIKRYKLTVNKLADILSISRATLYRYIDYYNNSNYEMIDEISLNTMKYIDSGQAKDKLHIVIYVYSLKEKKVMANEDDKLMLEIQKCLEIDSDSNKIKFLKILFFTKKFDKAIDYMMYLNYFMDDEGNIIYGNECTYLTYLEMLKSKESVTKETKKRIKRNRKGIEH